MGKGIVYSYALCKTCRLEIAYSDSRGGRPTDVGCPRCGGLCPVYCRSGYPLKGMVPTDLAAFPKRKKKREGK